MPGQRAGSVEFVVGRQGPNGDREEFAPIEQFFPCHGAVLTMLQSGEQLDVSHAMLPWQFHNVVTTPPHARAVDSSVTSLIRCS